MEFPKSSRKKRITRQKVYFLKIVTRINCRVKQLSDFRKKKKEMQLPVYGMWTQTDPGSRPVLAV